jgi:hypothetical protein
MNLKEIEKLQKLLSEIINNAQKALEELEIDKKELFEKLQEKTLNEDKEVSMAVSNDEAKEVLKIKKPRKPREKKECKKTITIVDDSNDEPLSVQV